MIKTHVYFNAETQTEHSNVDPDKNTAGKKLKTIGNV